MNDLKGKMLELKENITLVSIEDSVALLDTEKRCYYDLNDTAYFLLKLMEEGRQYETILAGFISDFNVSEESARIDIDHLIDRLLREGLLIVHEGKEEPLSLCSLVHGTRPYHTPLFEYQNELIFAGATPNPVTR